MKTASRPNRAAKPIITSVLARTAFFLFDAVQVLLSPFVMDIGCRKVLKRIAISRFYSYAEKKLNLYCLWSVYAAVVTLG